MFTSQGANEVRDNVVTDVNGNVPAPESTERKRVLSHEASLLLNKSLVGRPLMTPEVASIHVKNPEYRFRWVNFSGRNGMIYSQRKAMGFVDATADDVDVFSVDVTNAGGQFRAGDLILMKIRADLYDAAIKYNMIQALTLQRMRGVRLEGASTDVWATDAPRRVSVKEEGFARSGLAEPFIPDTGDVDKIVDESVSSGRADKTRQLMREMREKHETKVE